MPSVRAQYNDELVEAHREAVAALRELLAQETDPQERRKLANAILRARPAKDDAPPSLHAEGESAASSTGTNADVSIPPASSRGMSEARREQGGRVISSASANERISAQTDEDSDDDLDDLLDRELDELSHQPTNGSDPLAAIARLQAIMNQAMTRLPGSDTAQSA